MKIGLAPKATHGMDGPIRVPTSPPVPGELRSQRGEAQVHTLGTLHPLLSSHEPPNLVIANVCLHRGL